MLFRVARREYLSMWRDGRIRWAAALVLLLLTGSLAAGASWASTQSSERRAAQRENHEQWLGQGTKNPHSAAHYGVHAFKPLLPLALVDRGLESFLGTSTLLAAHYQDPFRYRPADDATALQRFGELTAASVMQLLVPLILVLLCVDAFASEREQGTLAQVLASGVRPGVLAAGKLLGIAAGCATLLGPPLAVGILALAQASPGGIDTHDAGRLGLMSVGYLLYYGTVLGVGLLVSAASRSARWAMVTLFAFWIGSALLVPRIVADAADARFKTPSASAFWETIGIDMAQGIDGHAPQAARSQQFKREVLAKYGVTRVEDLPVNLAGLQFMAGEEYGDRVFDRRYGELWATYNAQRRWYERGGLAAPVMAVRLVSMAAAGTDLAHFQDFSTASERYRRMLVKEMNGDLAMNSKGTDFTYVGDRDLWARIPEFAYSAPSASWAARGARTSLLILAMWALAANGVALIVAARVTPV